MINIGIGVSWAKALYSVANNVIANFKARVLSYPNSIFEAGPCLDTTLEELNAIGLLDNASLVITPNAYNEGVLYDVVPNTPLGDMDVVRTTTATRVNELGLIEIVPRNLFTYSEEFDNISWIKTQSTITPNTIAAPNGTITADTFAGNGVNNFHLVLKGITTTIGSSYTFTVYAKKNTNNFIQLSGNFSYGSNAYANFDLLNGVLGTVGSGATANIINVGNGWYRCILNLNTISSSGSNNIALITSATSIRVEPNTLTTSVYIWGAQFEQGSLTEYFPTTTRLNIPRIDYTNGSCPSLLVEPQRTNLLTYSNDYSNASWSKVGITAVLNSQLNPEGINSTYNISNTTLGDSYLEKQGLQTTAGNYTMSVFIKNIDNLTTSQLMAVHLVEGSVTSQLTYTWATNTFTLGGTNAISGSSILYNNGWVRLTFTYSIGSSVSNHWTRLYANQNLSITKSALVYGFQLEAGSYATSYIPTVATSVTRNADVISKTGISSLIGQTEGTLFVDITLPNNASTDIFNFENEGFDDIFLASNGGNLLGRIYYNGNALYFAQYSITSNGGRFKMLMTYKSGNSSFYVNGNLLSNNGGSFAFTNPLSKINLTNQNYAGYNKKQYNSVQLYKTALSDAECIALTTL